MFEIEGGADALAGKTPASELVKEVSEATFMVDVVDASNDVPVIVDFWAPWCGPCKALGPALEAAVLEKGGKVRMAKINVDENQNIAGQMQVQSIPAVFAFVKGQPVDGFMGNQTPAQIKEFVDRVAALAGPDEGLAEAVEAAITMLDEGAVTDAIQTFAAILGEEPENLAALAGMIRCYLKVEDFEKAADFLGTIPENLRTNPDIMQVAAEIDLAIAASETGETDELRAAISANENNHQARLDLAIALSASGDNEEAIETLLELFKRDREWGEEAAKKQLFQIFDLLGPKDPLAQKGRRRLTSMIFL